MATKLNRDAVLEWYCLCHETGVQNDGCLWKLTGLPVATDPIARNARFDMARDYLMKEGLIERAAEGGDLEYTREGELLLRTIINAGKAGSR